MRRSVFIAVIMETMTQERWNDGKLDERFDRIDERFDQVDRRFDEMNARFDRLYHAIIGVGGGIIATLAATCVTAIITQG
jgi:hypothetical protein